MDISSAPRRRPGEWLYRLLLRLYSPEFRGSAGGEMLEAYRQMSSASRGLLPRVGLWLRVALDLAVTVPPDRFGAWRMNRAARKRSGGGPMESIRHDLGYAIRKLRMAPGFTLAAALTVALGVAATTTILGVANGLLFRRMPGVVAPEQLVTAHRVSDGNDGFGAFSFQNLVDYRTDADEVMALAGFSTFGGNLSTGHDGPGRVFGMSVTGNYFDVVGAEPAFGRTFTTREAEEYGSGPVAVLSYGTWVSRFAGDSAVLGSEVRINGLPFTVIGVMPEEFNGHDGTIAMGLWLPITAKALFEDDPRRMNDRSATWIETIGRLEPGVTLPRAQAAMRLIAERLESAHPEANEGQSVRLLGYRPIFAAAAGPVAIFMGLLLGLSGTILLIGSVNVGSMLLARANARGREMGVRLAMGASRRRLIRQLLTESLVLFALGGAGGMMLSYAAASVISRIPLPLPIPLALEVVPDIRVLSVALGVTMASGLLFGLAPALQGTRQSLSALLSDGATAPGRSRLRSLFVVAQVAGSALLLVGAGLFLRGLQSADAIDPGFDPRGVHAVSASLNTNGYTLEEAEAFYRELRQRATALPGIVGVGFIDNLPLSLGNQVTVFLVPGRDPEPDVGLFRTDFSTVSVGYFETMRVPLAAGRAFTERDSRDAPGVIIVNETVARALWPGEQAVGRRLLFGSRDPAEADEVEVVGVVADGKYRMLGEDPRFMVFVPQAQSQALDYAMVVRSEPGSGQALASEFRAMVRQMDPDLPLEWNEPVTSIMALSLLPSRIIAGVTIGFGLVGLVLAALGLYGVLAQMVVQRTREIGVRMALGASGKAVRGQFLSHGLKLTGYGLLLGLGLAAVGSRFLGFFLYEVSPLDPVAFGGIALLMILVAWGACMVPAARASATAPMEALRHE